MTRPLQAPRPFDEPCQTFDLRDPAGNAAFHAWLDEHHPGKRRWVPAPDDIVGWVDYEGAPPRPHADAFSRWHRIYSGLLIVPSREVLTVGVSGTLRVAPHPNPQHFVPKQVDLDYIL